MFLDITLCLRCYILVACIALPCLLVLYVFLTLIPSHYQSMNIGDYGTCIMLVCSGFLCAGSYQACGRTLPPTTATATATSEPAPMQQQHHQQHVHRAQGQSYRYFVRRLLRLYPGKPEYSTCKYACECAPPIMRYSLKHAWAL
jgi:hypothetical protein